MNPNLLILNNNRRHNGYFNVAMHDNPHPPRRSKAAPISVKNSSRTAALYALLLAGQYAVQTAQALNKPPGRISEAINPRSGRTTKNDGNAEGESYAKTQERTDFGNPRSHANESHASDMPPTSTVASVELRDDFYRNSSFSSSLSGAPSGPTSSAFADSRLTNDSRSGASQPNVFQAQPHKRAVDDKNAPVVETAANDVTTEEHPLIVGRQKAVRNLLGTAAEGVSDAHLLAFANRIHADSEKDRNDGLVSDDDLALWKEEAKIWCAENGGDKHTVSEERCLEILKEAWDLALDPPRPLSVFKDWRQVRKEVEKNMTFSERARIKFTPNGSVGEAAQINAKTTKLYYKQFIDYIEKDIDRFVAAKAIANAESAGISRLEMEYPLGNVRVIRGVQLVTRSEVANTELTRSSESGRPAAYVFQFGGSPLEERYGFIGPDGQLLVFTRENARGSERQKGKFDILLNDSEILHAMGIPFSKNINASHLFCNNGNLKACSIKSFLVDKGGEDGYYSYLSCKSIKEIMEGQIRDGVEHYIKNFKAGNDGSDVIDKILGVVIPFYDQIIGGINDPGHRVDLKDIAFDLFDLGISLTTIGWSGVKIIGTGVAAAKAAIFSGKGIFAALRALKENIKISKFIRISGRELIDFISPPFTGDLLRRMADGVSLPPEGLIQKLNKFDEENMLRPRNFDGADALRCKRGIFGDCIPRLRSTKENEILEGFDYLDHIYKKIDEKFKSPYLTPRGVKDRINKNAEKEIPRVLYRAQPRPGAQPVGAGNYYAEVGFTGPAHATYDDVLAYAIKHTASVGGIKDKAASFSGRRDVAVDFMRDNRDKGYALFKIKRPIGVNQFRRIEYIIKYDGPRLVKEGKITQDELIDAVAQAHISVEEEIFYVANFGKIPQDLVTEVL